MTATDPSIELMRLINGYQVSQALHVAATLGVAAGRLTRSMPIDMPPEAAPSSFANPPERNRSAVGLAGTAVAKSGSLGSWG